MLSLRSAGRLLAFLLVPLFFIVLWDITPGDLIVAHWYGAAHGFDLKQSGWLVDALHTWPRRAGMLLLLLCLLAVWHPPKFWKRSTQAERIWLVCTILCCAILVPGLRALSHTSCPWDLKEFGGAAHYVWHFTFGGTDGGAGRCFPSGHASAFFSFLPAFWVMRRHNARFAWTALACFVVFGLGMSWVQVVRGAHFPSHLLWTGWLCWAVSCLASPLLDRYAKPASEAAPESEPAPATMAY